MVIFRWVRLALFPVMYLHPLTGGDDSGLATPTCALQRGGKKSMQAVGTHTRMVLLTHASDTPWLGDTGCYGNITLEDSQVSVSVGGQ